MWLHTDPGGQPSKRSRAPCKGEMPAMRNRSPKGIRQQACPSEEGSKRATATQVKNTGAPALDRTMKQLTVISVTLQENSSLAES